MTTTSVSGMEPAGDERIPAGDPGRVLCDVLIDALPVHGASISIVGDQGDHSIVGASDELAKQLEASQFALGVGPHWDALRTARPAFLYDIAGEGGQGTWLAVAAEADRLGAAALMAFPLRLGSLMVGVADLYSRSPGERWTARTVVLASELALGIAEPAVRIALRSAGAERSRTGPNAVELRREVHQATGMVMGQLDCDPETALLLLRAHAFATSRSLDAVAGDVIRRRLDLSEG